MYAGCAREAGGGKDAAVTMLKIQHPCWILGN
jgi:hypothetical protein